MASASSVQDLFRDRLSVRVSQRGRPDAQMELLVRMYSTNGCRTVWFSLTNEVTEPLDDLLLFMTEITEQHFVVIKNEQNFLGDFPTWIQACPQFLLSLKSSPHTFSASLTVHANESYFAVTEQLRYHSHQKLLISFSHSTDRQIKSWLADRCLELQNRLGSSTSNERDSQQQLQQLQLQFHQLELANRFLTESIEQHKLVQNHSFECVGLTRF